MLNYNIIDAKQQQSSCLTLTLEMLNYNIRDTNTNYNNSFSDSSGSEEAQRIQQTHFPASPGSWHEAASWRPKKEPQSWAQSLSARASL